MVPGGVCAVLDYDVDQMTQYVAIMAQRCVMPKAQASPAFRKFVSGLLTSTRLPSTTILLGLNYLAKRINTPHGAGHFECTDSGEVWRMLTIGLLLGSKFLDDNTFQNRSWSEVSGISVAELNKMEYEWLNAISWDMFVNLDRSEDYNAWLRDWHKYRIDKEEERKAAATERMQPQPQPQPLPPINTNVQHLFRGPVYPSYGAGMVKPTHDRLPPYQARPNFEASQSWLTSHPTPQLTPPSAPDSGLNTPEYLSATGGGPRYDWTLFNQYQQRPYPQQSQAGYAAPQIASYNHTPYTNSYSSHHGANMWDSSVTDCGCTMCAPPKQPFFMGMPYGSQPLVAG